MGSVDHPDDIVLTREDFMRYSDTRGALAAIVQAMLITHHMLFVGFSLRDDNFLRIADEVRKVMRRRALDAKNGHRPFGTALLLNPSTLIQSLWKDDIACVGIDGEVGESATALDQQPSTKAAANQLEILLDYVLYEANQNVGHLLDDRYADLLSPEEAQLKAALRTLQEATGPSVRRLPAWDHVAALLTRLGGRAQ
jgi:hypothetical protein